MKVSDACAKGGVSFAQFFVWKAEDPQLEDAYAQAREERGERYFEENVDIADQLPERYEWRDKESKKYSDAEYQALSSDERTILGIELFGLSPW